MLLDVTPSRDLQNSLFDFELGNDDEVSAGFLDTALVHGYEYVHVPHTELLEPFIDRVGLDHLIHLLALLELFVGVVYLD